MAGKVVKDMKEDFLVCSICMGPFKTPKMLPCAHSFCEQCLEKYTAKQDDSTLVMCPTCRKVRKFPETGVKGLQTNLFLISLAEKIQLLERATVAGKRANPCESCKSPEVVAFCADCDFAICSACKGHHALFPALRDHDVVPLNKLSEPKFQQEWRTSKSPYCEVHPSEKLRFFCQTCSKIVCRECKINGHSKHRGTGVMDQVTNSRGKLHTLVKESEICLMEGVKFVSKGEEGLKAMEVANHELESEIDKHLIAMMTTIEKMFQEQKQRIVADIALRPKFVNDQIQIAKDWIGRITNIHDISWRLLREDNPWGIVAMSGKLTKAFDDLRLESPTLNWFKCDLKPDIVFTPSVSTPDIDLGSHDYLPDFVCSDGQGKFVFCQYHSATGRIVIHKKSLTTSGTDTEKYPPIGPIKIVASEEMLRACYDDNNLYLFSGTALALVELNFKRVQLVTGNLHAKGKKIQHISRDPSRERVCIVDDSREQNLISGKFTHSTHTDPRECTFQSYSTHTLETTSPVTYFLPAQYDVLYFTRNDELNTYDRGDHRFDRKYEINPPENVMDIFRTRVLHAVCNETATMKHYPGNRNSFTVFMLWEGWLQTKEWFQENYSQSPGWLIAEYDTKSERVVGVLENMQREANPMAPSALYHGGAGCGTGRQIDLCDYTGSITRYKRGPFTGEPVQYEKA